MGTLRFTLDEQYSITSMIDKLIGSLPNGVHKNILNRIASLSGQAEKVYRYDQLLKDLLGFNLPREHAVVLHEKLLGLREALLALVLWHENGHILMDNGELEITVTPIKTSVALPGKVLGGMLTSSKVSKAAHGRVPGKIPESERVELKLTINGTDFELTDRDAKLFAYMAYRETDPQKCNHYLLRAVAREIFGKLDIELSGAIDRILGKSATSGEGESTGRSTGGVNLGADWLKVKATNKDRNAKASSQAFSDADFTGLRVVIKGLVPAGADAISRLIHRPAAR